MNEKIISAGNIKICTETFGKPSDPAVLLLMGAVASMVWWPEEFCKRLASKDRFVIRYDHRDTGRSQTYPPATINYTVEDMADDAVKVLDYYNIKNACFAGMSLGGIISQVAALNHPDKVKSLALISSEPVGIEFPDVPWVDEKVLSHHAKGQELDWSDREKVINYMTDGWGLLSGSKHQFERDRIYKIAELEFDRADNLLSSFNHALLTFKEDYKDSLNKIDKPAVIIHGTEDKVIQYIKAETMHKAISGSKLVTLEGVGHELHSNDWDLIISEIIAVSY